jgi:sialic acid synthase SpsE
MSFQFILEAGVNHDGNLSTAINMIHEAAKTGATAIKFQSYTASRIAAVESPYYWDLQEESTESQRELFEKYDNFKLDDYRILKTECDKVGIEFMTTCFDETWVDSLDPLLTRYKIASADITNYQLLEHISNKQKPIILSTGAAKISEIDNAIELISSISKSEISLLHCVLNYPTSAANANLGRISHLRSNYPNYKVGYSDHTKPSDSFIVLPAAFALGSTIFEKHFTLTKTKKGNDHYHSFDSNDVIECIKILRNLSLAISFDEHRFIELQEKARKYARRGLYAKGDIEPGCTIRNEDIISLRPIPENGISASEISSLIGLTSKQKIKAGAPFTVKDLEN